MNVFLGLLLGCPRPAPVPVVAAPPPIPSPPVAAARWSVDPNAPPNVLVLVIDDMGVDKQAIYGEHPRPSPTPVLDALAARSAVFRTAWATPGCTPTRAAALTGRYATKTGAGIPAPMPGEAWQLPLDEVTIPEVLAPWASAAIGKWHLATFASRNPARHPLDQGFDVFDGTLGNLPAGFPDVPAKEQAKHDFYRWVHVDATGEIREDTRYATTAVADDAIEILGDLPPPWFGWVGWHAVHVPLDPPPADLWTGSLGDDPRHPDRYDAVAAALDHEIGRLLAAIPPEVLARTVVFVVGDNGTPAHARRAPSDPTRGKMTLFEGGIRVPLYVSGPGIAPGFREQLVHVVDLLPTVADLAGVPAPPGIDGVSFLPALRDPTSPGREVLYTEYLAPNGPPPWRWLRRTARDASFQLIVDENGAEKLLDLRVRPDGGPDLLPGPSGPEAEAALARLRAEIAARTAGAR